MEEREELSRERTALQRRLRELDAVLGPEDAAAGQALPGGEPSFEPEAVGWSVHDGRVVYMSPGAASIFGYPVAAFTADAGLWRSIIHADDRVAVEAACASALVNGSVELEHRIVTPAGETRWIRVRARVARAGSGVPSQVDALVTDITDQRASQEALRRMEKQVRCVLEVGWDIVSMHDEVGQLYYMNSAGHRVHGFTLAELQARSPAEMIHPDDLPAVTAVAEELLADPGGNRSVELRYRRKDGRWVRLEVAAVNMLHDPDVGSVVCITREIAPPAEPEGPRRDALWLYRVPDERIADREVFASRGFLEGVLDSLSSCIAVIASDGRIVAVNAAWRRDAAGGGFLGAACRVGDNYVDECDRAEGASRRSGTAAAQGIREVLSGRSGVFGLEYGVGDGASTGWFVMRVTPVPGGGDPIHAVVAHTEVTKRLRTEQALRRSDERFRHVLDSSWDVIVIAGIDHRYFYASASVQRVLGYTPDEFCRFRLTDLLHPDDLELAEQMSSSVPLTPRAAQTFEARIRHKEGFYVWMELSGVNLIHDPAVRGIVFSQRDITERRQTQEALVSLNAELEQRVAARTAELRAANAALEQASRSKDEFLASMSHELRTPLNAVLGLSEAMQEGVYGAVEERGMGALRRIEESGRHLLSLINDILDLSKLEAGKMEIEPRPVSIADVCRASLALVQEAAQKKRQVISLRVSDSIAAIDADERRLKQILVNLLSNAVKFTPDGGTVGLEIAGAEVEGAVRFTVWDTGVGIRNDELPRLFQPFMQLDSSLSRRHAGTGLGLALVRKLVELHSGTIEVDSEVGKGSRFSLILPGRRARAERARLNSPPLGTPAVGRVAVARPRILLAEDDETNISTVTDFLRARGYDVSVAHDGQEAVALAGEILPGVILMDVQMPVMDGLTAIRSIRSSEMPELRDVPIIALTALAMSGDRERCLAAGATDHLPKPVSLRRLSAAILEQLSRRTRTPSSRPPP